MLVICKNRFLAAFILTIGLLLAVQLQASTAAKYVILFHGDGMGSEHVRAGGMYVNGAAGTLVFESFANQTTMTHNNATNGTTDSAASASAMATGTKVNNGVISVQLPGNGADMTSILERYKILGKSTGLVTESFMTDASPAAHGAHDSSRNNYAAIFNDYVTQTRPNILFGGGGNGFDTALAATNGYAVVTNRAALLGLNTETQTWVAGSFGTGLIPADGTAGRDATLPTLPEMTQQALAILDNDPDGFYLFVEHEGIDEASHANNTLDLVLSMKEFNSAVQKAIDWVNDPATDADWTNTLILVLADHETGGLTVTEANPQAGIVPAATWSSTGHTQTAVPVRALGNGAAQITGAQIDNTAIFTILGPPSTQATLTAGNDTWMDSGSPAATHGADSKLAVDGSPDNGALIKWDLSSIPSGSTITLATVSFYLPDVNDQSTSSFEFYACRHGWSDINATWNTFDTGQAWGAAGAQSSTTDYFPTVLATSPSGGTPPVQLSVPLNADGIAQLQRWVNGIDANYGFVIFDYADTSSDGFRFNSFDSTHPPQLILQYRSSGAIPTSVPTLSASVVPTSTPTPTATHTATHTAVQTCTGTASSTPNISAVTQEVLAFPNPARHTVKFAFQNPAAERVHIVVYNFVGEKIADLRQEQNTGQFLEWQLDAVAPGVYFYQSSMEINGQPKKLSMHKLAVIQ